MSSAWLEHRHQENPSERSCDGARPALHPDAELGAIAGILQPWIANGQLPDDTLTTLAALVESKKGQALIVYDAFSQLFKDMEKTYDQMIDDGLLEG